MHPLTCGLLLLLALTGLLSASPICTEGDTLAIPSDCGSFYLCSQGILERRPCPAGLHFNAALLVCDYPAAAGCDPSAGVQPNDCPPNVASAHLPHPRCQRYYQCAFGVAYERSCQASLHWHQAAQACNWPAQAGCVEGEAREQPGAVLLEPAAVTTVAPVTTEAPEVTEAPIPTPDEAPCERACDAYPQQGYRLFAHPDCKFFYECVGTVTVLRECPERFSAFYNACVASYVSECVDGEAPLQCLG